MDIEFHCKTKSFFPHKRQQIRGFLLRNYKVSPHTHDFYEMNIVMHGKGTHQIENARFSVKTGDVFVVPPLTAHAYFDTSELEVYHILLHKSFIRNNLTEASTIPGFLQLFEIEPYLRQHFSQKLFLHLSLSQIIQLKTDLSIIYDGSIYDTKELIPLKTHTMWKILYWLSSLLYKQMYQADNETSIDKYVIEINKVLEYIHQHYDDKITIDSLCKKTFLSRSTFIRSFNHVCECTPLEYVNKYRCKKAIEMMESTRFSKTEIAHLCGFYDLSHMERTLKQLL